MKRDYSEEDSFRDREIEKSDSRLGSMRLCGI